MTRTAPMSKPSAGSALICRSSSFVSLATYHYPTHPLPNYVPEPPYKEKVQDQIHKVGHHNDSSSNIGDIARQITLHK
jgi:hypothetical protein